LLSNISSGGWQDYADRSQAVTSLGRNVIHAGNVIVKMTDLQIDFDNNS